MTSRNVLKARGMFAIGAIAGLLLVAGCGGGDDEGSEETETALTLYLFKPGTLPITP